MVRKKHQTCNGFGQRTSGKNEKSGNDYAFRITQLNRPELQGNSLSELERNPRFRQLTKQSQSALKAKGGGHCIERAQAFGNVIIAKCLDSFSVYEGQRLSRLIEFPADELPDGFMGQLAYLLWDKCPLVLGDLIEATKAIALSEGEAV